jgi:hypothetical protein
MNLSAEWRLLLACAKTDLTIEEQQKIAETVARGDLDWDGIGRMSFDHGIAPLIYHSLRRSGVMESVPAPAAQRLRDSYYGNAARNASLFNDLGAVLAALKQESIDVIVLKGAALAEIAYPHKALRPMNDIDLLVKKKNLHEAGSKLLSMGYRRDASKVFSEEHHYHFVFKKTAGISIEIHWDIKYPTDPSKIVIDDLWRRAQSASIPNVTTLILSPEDLLLHLCHHAYKHNFTGGIRPLCDIAEAARFYAGRINWETVIGVACEWQIAPCVHIGLSLARELLHARVPQSVLRDLRPVSFNINVITWTRERILTNPDSSAVFPELLQLFWKGRSFRERWTVLRKVISSGTAPTCRSEGSGSKRHYFFYLRRISYLVRQYGPLVWGLVSGDPRVRASAEKLDNQLRLTQWLS